MSKTTGDQSVERGQQHLIAPLPDVEPTVADRSAQFIYEHTHQHSTESLLEYHNRLRLLHVRAYPFRGDCPEIIERFARSLLRHQVGHAVIQQRPSNYQIALRVAQEAHAVYAVEAPRVIRPRISRARSLDENRPEERNSPLLSLREGSPFLRVSESESDTNLPSSSSSSEDQEKGNSGTLDFQ